MSSRLTTVFLVPILSTSLIAAADWSSYRGFRFGSNLVSIAKLTGARPSQARVVHQRPALIQELDWRPDNGWSATGARADSLRDGVLRFYDGTLYQIVAVYDSQRLEGLSQADMVTAISQTYGTAATTDTEIPFKSVYADTARVLARWETTEYSVDLVRTGDQSSYALVLSLKRLNQLAQGAVAEATRLDALEAPQREIDSQNQKEAEKRLALEKARSVNLPAFRP